MKRGIISIIIVIISALPAQAELITIEITAEVEEVDDRDNFLEGKINVGDIIRGKYIYDSETPDSKPNSQTEGLYIYSNPPYGIFLEGGGFKFETNPHHTDYHISIFNDHVNPRMPDSSPTDIYNMYSRNNLPLSNGVRLRGIEIYLKDNSAQAVTSVELPLTAPILDNWEENRLSIFTDTYHETRIYSSITSATLIPESATIYYVDADANGLNDGSSWIDAYNYLQDALADANSSPKPVEISVAQGIYKPDQGLGITPGDRMATFQLINDVTLNGGYAGFGEPDPSARDIDLFETILSGDLIGNDGPNFAYNGENSYHVVTAYEVDETTCLEGFTITGGNANDSNLRNRYGGGMYSESSSLRISNCIFTNNFAERSGGGICYWDNSSPTLTNCTFRGNSSSSYSGIIFCTSRESHPLIENCTISDNRTGGIHIAGGNSTITNCIISNNTGFGILWESRDYEATITNCTIVGNGGTGIGFVKSSGTIINCYIAENGATGIGCYCGLVTIINCTIARNLRAGIGCSHASPTVTNSNIVGNGAEGILSEGSAIITNCTIAGNMGGVVLSYYGGSTITNCILWSNSPQQILSGTASVTYSNVQGGWPGIGNIEADPLFIDTGYWDANGVWIDADYRLLPGSPCINAGDPNYIAESNETDLDGKPRVIGGRIDMGAYEYTSTLMPILRISPTELMFYATQGGSNPKSQVISIRNIGSGTLNWEIAEDCPWLQVDPTNGESTGQVNEVTLSVDISGLDPNVHNCQLTITANEAANSPQMAKITLYLGVVLRVPSEYTTIQAAIDAAKDGDTVLVTDGIYRGDGNRDLNFGGKVITVSSENSPDTCIIDCNGTEDDPHRGFYFHSGEHCNSVVTGFTITNGYARSGGGIYCSGSSPTLINCTFSGNKAEYSGGWPWPGGDGGGIYCDGGSPTLTNCTFTDNSAVGSGIQPGNGGGMSNYGSDPTLTNCTFTDNSAVSRAIGGSTGGGMYNRNGSNATVINCTFSGNSASYGGGMYNIESSPTLTNCTFTDNSAVSSGPGESRGGGMSNYGSSPTLTNCTFSRNSANSGGGMCNIESSPTLTNCTFTDNSAVGRAMGGRRGGGMVNYESDPTLTNCTFTDNSAVGSWMQLSYGGGMGSFGGNPMLSNCTFNNNSADQGGGMHNRESCLTMANCMFNGNSASRSGGGMHNYGSSPTLTNCTFSGNSASISGGGISHNDTHSPPPFEPSPEIANGIIVGNADVGIFYNSNDGDIIITNCIIWGNEAPDGPEIYLESNSNFSVSYSDVLGGWPGFGNIDADPCFVELGYWDANDVWIEGDYHLLEGSPCIDAGDPNYIAEPNETDLDGLPRVIGGRIDMGAYESPVPAEVRIVPRTINLASEGKWITCYISLPEDYNVADIDSNSVFLEDEIQAESFRVDEQQQVAIAKFKRADAQGILEVGEVELTVTGQLLDGTVFEGTETIKVINKGHKNK